MDNTPLVPADQVFSDLPVPRRACQLSVLKTGTLKIPGRFFVEGLQGDLLMSNYSFLIEHHATGRKVLFDLGLRKDLAYPSRMDRLFEVWPCTAPSSPLEILARQGIQAGQIDTVILSHTHFDHIGDVRDFPATTTFQFGPYSDRSKITDRSKLAASLCVEPHELEGRKIQHLSEADWETYGSLRGVDYFEDGSLILLDTPGHMEGHLGALVCVSNGNSESNGGTSDRPLDLYYLLGGDAAHHISLVDYGNPSRIGVYKAKENALSSQRETDPESLHSFEDDLQEAKKTMAKLARMGHESNINILLAHDMSLDNVLDSIASEESGSTKDAIDFVRLKGSMEEHSLIRNRKITS